MEKFVCNTENAISRVSGILKEFIVNIIRVIANNVNSVVKKVTLNSSIIVINIFSTDFAKLALLQFGTPFLIDDSGAEFHAD